MSKPLEINVVDPDGQPIEDVRFIWDNVSEGLKIQVGDFNRYEVGRDDGYQEGYDEGYDSASTERGYEIEELEATISALRAEIGELENG